MSAFIVPALALLSLVMTAQAAHTIYLMIYTWNREALHDEARAPRQFRVPHVSFSVLLPARHEEQVIGQTIERVVRANYPQRLLEAIVICEVHDTGTIATVRATIDRLAGQGHANIRLVPFDDGPITPPHALGKGLATARHEAVAIFDAEDEIHPDIFNVVNTVMCADGVRVVQSGVQLMNYNSRWFSAHNVLEYYFWFKSRLHAHAQTGMTPLGGNTVFFGREVLRRIGGWDETNLTEDADIGIRLSTVGESVRVVYEDEYVTKEETPPTLGGFIKQRTRWNQGFLQILRKGTWRQTPHLANRLRALYLLAFPFVQAVQVLYVPVSLAMIVLFKMPIVVTLLLFVPGYLLLGQYVMSVVGLYTFARAHALRLPFYTPLVLLLTYFPFQWTLGYAALRAVWREVRGVTNWEKTAHIGAHRQPTPGGTRGDVPSTPSRAVG